MSAHGKSPVRVLAALQRLLRGMERMCSFAQSAARVTPGPDDGQDIFAGFDPTKTKASVAGSLPLIPSCKEAVHSLYHVRNAGGLRNGHVRETEKS